MARTAEAPVIYTETSPREMVPLSDSAIREMEQRGELLPRDIHNCVLALCFVRTPALSAGRGCH